MKHQQATAPKFFSKKRCIILSVVTLLLIIPITVITQPKIANKLSSFINSVRLDRSPGESDFPDIDTANLSPTRQKIISLAKTEFKAQSAGAKFSQGAEEAWCANFVSWIIHQAGTPLKNPHTGGWRIPGTFTLREYYEATGRFKPANSGYQPLPGDAAIYHNSPVFGDHTNIVLKNDNGVLTTVGGNEANRIRVFVNRDKQYDGLLGYGVPTDN
ncbi:CHAP domain-containing protein [Candidatus Saccharibacteria bacterium]|mgnify:FL=1|nr:CHAP domain-containing protein [Candidatus Saccharibacteria bacterium]